MALPEPYEDEDPEPEDEVTGHPGPAAKPEWLVGANEALESEFGGSGADPAQPPPELRAAVPAPPRQPAGPRPINPYEGFATSAAGRASMSSWIDPGLAGPHSQEAQVRPAPEEKVDPDDPFGHGRARAEADAAADDELAGPETPSEKARWAPPPPPPKPWWEPLIAQALTPPGLVAIGVLVIAVIAGLMLFGPKDNSVSLSKLRHNAASYDGRLVKVHGKVGEVYPVGGGYSFYLLQGRDTMVVFTRSRTPVTDAHVSVNGVVSTGVLNGAVRQAVLESTP